MTTKVKHDRDGRVILMFDNNFMTIRRIEFIPNGSRTYIWVGDDSGCYGHVSGTESLRQFATELLAALGEKPTRRKAHQ